MTLTRVLLSFAFVLLFVCFNEASQETRAPAAVGTDANTLAKQVLIDRLLADIAAIELTLLKQESSDEGGDDSITDVLTTQDILTTADAALTADGEDTSATHVRVIGTAESISSATTDTLITMSDTDIANTQPVVLGEAWSSFNTEDDALTADGEDTSATHVRMIGTAELISSATTDTFMTMSDTDIANTQSVVLGEAWSSFNTEDDALTADDEDATDTATNLRVIGTAEFVSRATTDTLVATSDSNIASGVVGVALSSFNTEDDADENEGDDAIASTDVGVIGEGLLTTPDEGDDAIASTDVGVIGEALLTTADEGDDAIASTQVGVIGEAEVISTNNDLTGDEDDASTDNSVITTADSQPSSESSSIPLYMIILIVLGVAVFVAFVVVIIQLILVYRKFRN